jgi:hypothetical protein
MNARYKYSIILLFTCPPFLVFAQSDTAKINFIKAQYANINASLKFDKKVEKEDTSETTEGNEITLYLKGDTIKKISAIYYGETGKTLQEYYFFSKKLIFYYFEEDRYDMPVNAKNGGVKVASKKEKRYYFNDRKIFLIKSNPKETVSPTEITKLSAETEKEASRLMRLK